MENSVGYNQTGNSKLSTWLFNPFHFIAGGKALAIGLPVILLAGVLSYTGYHRFDGLLDFHAIGDTRGPFWMFLADGLCAWLILSILLSACAKLFSPSRVRLIDIFGTQSLARWPTLIQILIVQHPAVRDLFIIIIQKLDGGEVSVLEIILSIGLHVISLVLIIWMVALMYRAFAVSSNLRGGRAATCFIGSVLIGEIISKIVLYNLLK